MLPGDSEWLRRPKAGMHARVMALANQRVTITNHLGRRERVSLFEARLMELASGHCRRVLCTDFIELVMAAAASPPPVFDDQTAQLDLEHMLEEVLVEFGGRRGFRPLITDEIVI